MEIHDFIETNDIEKILALSKAETFDINITNKDGWSPLIIAAFNGNLPLCKTLISLGANFNQSNCNGSTPEQKQYLSLVFKSPGFPSPTKTSVSRLP